MEWAEFHHVMIGDVTGDGKDDLISYGETEDPVSPRMLYVYPQSPSGLLESARRFVIDGWDPVVGLSLADMNGDGVDDIVVTHAQGISLLLTSDSGGLSLQHVSSTEPDGLETNVAAVSLDVDQDGAMDLVSHLSVTHAESGNMTLDRRSRFRVLFGDGRGGVLRSEDTLHFGVETGDYGHYDKDSVTSLAIGDLNGDGLNDLVTASRKFVFADQQNPPFISIYENTGLGGFAEPFLISLADIGGEYVGVGDFNGDGRKDLAVTDSSNITPIRVFHQRADGFRPVPDYARRTGSISVSVNGADLDLDGRDDLLIGHSNWGLISHYLQGNGVIAEAVFTALSGFAGYRLTGSISTSGVASGDLNSDGCTDVAVAASFNGLQVFLGSDCAPRRVTGGRYPGRRRH